MNPSHTTDGYCTWCGEPLTSVDHAECERRASRLEAAYSARSQDEAMSACPPDWRLDDRVSWMEPGALVWYCSSPYHRHAGVILREPRVYRDGWTVVVGELDPAVPKASGSGRVSRAAWWEAVTPRAQDDSRSAAPPSDEMLDEVLEHGRRLAELVEEHREFIGRGQADRALEAWAASNWRLSRWR